MDGPQAWCKNARVGSLCVQILLQRLDSLNPSVPFSVLRFGRTHPIQNCLPLLSLASAFLDPPPQRLRFTLPPGVDPSLATPFT